jgi:predicted nuclease of predicted toxin-antitoxin system
LVERRSSEGIGSRHPSLGSAGYVVFTHDLDFGAILAATGIDSPSVIQIRSQDVTPLGMRKRILATLAQFAAELARGSLVSVDEASGRARILPID